jgi:hypothetical protein
MMMIEGDFVYRRVVTPDEAWQCVLSAWEYIVDHGVRDKEWAMRATGWDADVKHACAFCELYKVDTISVEDWLTDCTDCPISLDYNGLSVACEKCTAYGEFIDRAYSDVPEDYMEYAREFYVYLLDLRIRSIK